MQVVHWCKEKGIGLVLVGPEAPLVAGLVDSLKQSGIRCSILSMRLCLRIGWARSLPTCSRHGRCGSSHVPETDATWLLVMQACVGIDLRQDTCRAFGPNAAAAQLEGSKAFLKVPWPHLRHSSPAWHASHRLHTVVTVPVAVANLSTCILPYLEGPGAGVQDLCREYNIPTGSYAVFREPEPAKRYIQEQGAPHRGEGGGPGRGQGRRGGAWPRGGAGQRWTTCWCSRSSGTQVSRPSCCAVRSKQWLCLRPACRSALAAVQPRDAPVCCNEFMMDSCSCSCHLEMCLKLPACSGSEIIVEEFLDGEEASFFALIDGSNCVALASAQVNLPVYLDGSITQTMVINIFLQLCIAMTTWSRSVSQ